MNKDKLAASILVLTLTGCSPELPNQNTGGIRPELIVFGEYFPSDSCGEVSKVFSDGTEKATLTNYRSQTTSQYQFRDCYDLRISKHDSNVILYGYINHANNVSVSKLQSLNSRSRLETTHSSLTRNDGYQSRSSGFWLKSAASYPSDSYVLSNGIAIASFTRPSSASVVHVSSQSQLNHRLINLMLSPNKTTVYFIKLKKGPNTGFNGIQIDTADLIKTDINFSTTQILSSWTFRGPGWSYENWEPLSIIHDIANDGRVLLHKSDSFEITDSLGNTIRMLTLGADKFLPRFMSGSRDSLIVVQRSANNNSKILSVNIINGAARLVYESSVPNYIGSMDVN